MKKAVEFADGMIRAAVTDHLGALMIDNVRRKNALTAAMWRAVPEAVRWLATDGEARVIILSGAGDTDFCAGADISEFGEVRRDSATARLYEAENSAAFAAIRCARVPTVASIRGICYGGGFGLAAAADLRISDRTARFCVPPAKLGLAYPADAVADLVRALGDQMARFALFTGAVMTPAQLQANGFLLDCVEPDTLEATVQALAQTIATNAPLSIRAAKLALRSLAEDEPSLAHDAILFGAATFDSADYAEGRKAFAERRKPLFQGR